MSEFVERDLLNGYNPDYEPSRKGLDQLKASASSDFSALQLDTLVKEMRKLHSGPITIVDLRKETHGLIFHCLAGRGRTTMYMVSYDFLRNPDVSEKDVIYRHYKLGGNFMYYQGDKPKEAPFKVPLAKEKAEMIPLVYKYIQENQPKGFRMPWAQWKKTAK